MEVTFNKTITHTFTPEEVAAMFCNMDDREQAAFFNAIADIVQAKWDSPFSLQMSAVDSCHKLTRDGRFIMKTIGEFSEPQPIS